LGRTALCALRGCAPLLYNKLMTMKAHILAALREQFDQWEVLLARLNEEQITAPRFDLDWSIQDVIAHLWGWQQISIARLEAAAHDHPPELPARLLALSGDWEESVDRTNAWIHENNHARPWPEVYQNWREGFLRLLESAVPIPEKDLLNGDRYTWLNGYSPADILIASYDHHQEHHEKVTTVL
jgi:hypothetical protein